jgi:hypothetical protein
MASSLPLNVSSGHKKASQPVYQLERPISAIAKELLLSRDNLAILVEAAVRAHAMRKLNFAALRANRTRGSSDFVVSAAAGMSAGAAHFLFRYCHDLLLALCPGAHALVSIR